MAAMIWVLLLLPVLFAGASFWLHRAHWTRWRPRAAAVGLLATGVGFLVAVAADAPLTTADGLLRVDSLSAWMLTVIGAVAIVALWGGLPSRHEGTQPGGFAALLSLFLAAMTLAVVAGASIGFGGGAGVVVAAFAGGVAAVSATYMVSRGVGHGGSATVVVLAGVAVAAFANAAQTFIQQRNIETIQRVYSWMLGNLGVTRWGSVALVAVPAVICCVAVLGAARVLDVMTVGDLEARTLGVDPAFARLALVAVATLGTAAVVSVSGLIGFVGIIVPHALRLVVGPGHRLLLPLTLIWGAIFLLLADTLARTIMAPAELPVGVVTAAVGAPFFLFILRRFSRAARAGQ